MDSIDRIIRRQIDEVIDRADEYSLPEFLAECRKATQLPADVVCKHLKIHHTTLSKLEANALEMRLNNDLIDNLVRYYGIPSDVLQDKASAFMKRHGLLKGIGYKKDRVERIVSGSLL